MERSSRRTVAYPWFLIPIVCGIVYRPCLPDLCDPAIPPSGTARAGGGA